VALGDVALGDLALGYQPPGDVCEPSIVEAPLLALDERDPLHGEAGPGSTRREPLEGLDATPGTPADPAETLQELELPVSRPPVDAEVAVEREDSCLLVDLGTSDQTRIGQ